MKEERIQIKLLSVNQAWKGRRFKTPKYTKFERDLGYLLPKLEVPKGKLRILFVFYFKNSLSDIDNPLKMVLDIMQKKYNFNDKDIYKLEVEKRISENEGFEFNIYEL